VLETGDTLSLRGHYAEDRGPGKKGAKERRRKEGEKCGPYPRGMIDPKGMI